ncbi:unnamed protein product [Malus baccata var. baccata]
MSLYPIKRKTDPFLHAPLVPRPNPILQAEREVVRELRQLLHLPPHLHYEVIEFWLEVLLDAVAEQLREPPEHRQHVSAGEADFFEVVDSGQELVFHAAGEEGGVFVNLGNTNALEEVEGGAEAGFDTASEESGPAVDDAAEIGAVDVGFAEEEGEDWGDVGDSGGEDFGAHADEAAEFWGGEADGGEEEGEEVEADGVEVEDFFLEVGVGGGGSWWGFEGGRGFGGGDDWEVGGFLRRRKGAGVMMRGGGGLGFGNGIGNGGEKGLFGGGDGGGEEVGFVHLVGWLLFGRSWSWLRTEELWFGGKRANEEDKA